ncbi:MAG: hypothetical protein P8Y27_15170 [Chromatiaceae bacterium]
MLKPSLFAACLTLLLASPLAAPVQARADGHPIAPRLAGLGTHHHPITAASPEAQRFFDQGLILSFGFNHREAARSFRQAQALDPACAMCYWGEALVLGPNINARMDAADNPRAYEAVQRALALAAQVSAPERAYIAQCHAQGLYPVAYVPHNHHFLAAAASFIGAKEKALAASLHIRDHQDTQLMRQPGYATLQHYWSMPYFAWVRFGQWDRLLTEPAPAEDLIYPSGIWSYARGLAQVRTGDLDGAAASLQRLATIADDPEMAATRLWEINTMAQILGIAREVLSGELALARGASGEAIEHLQTAVRLEDELTYVEPSDWYVPARHNLGAALLASGRAPAAEAVYRKDLEVYPANGWSLAGLAQSLRAQGKTAEADQVRRRLAQVWVGHGGPIATSRL